MKKVDKIIEQLKSDDSDQMFEVARLAELGISASAVIHELRQPLTALSMSLQMTYESARKSCPLLEKDLNEAIQLVAKSEMLLDRAKDFMKPSAGFVEVDVSEVIEKVVTVLQWQVDNMEDVTLESIVEDNIPPINGDQAQLEQLFTNLISNALDIVKECGDGRVEIHTKIGADSNVEILVADNGSGINKDVETQIFDPFFSTKGNAKGTGLGLYIVSKIAQRHNATCVYLDKDKLSKDGIQNMNTGFMVRFGS